MQRIGDWIRANKLATLLILVVAFLVWKQGRYGGPILPMMSGGGNSFYARDMAMAEPAMMTVSESAVSSKMMLPPSPDGGFAPSDGDDRLVIRDTSLSLVVDDVAASLNKIEMETERLGGFLVNSNLNTPEGASSGMITVRVPETRRAEAMEMFKGLAVRVVSENVNGRDVTDEYVDIEERMVVLEKTKTKFESILDSASEVGDLLQVQRELTNIQVQIDNLKGRAEYLDKSASLSLIHVYLSTDELALPYTPDEVWRPIVVFKEAIRSLIKSARGSVNWVIWAAVYTPIWLPVVVIGWMLFKKR